jgi:hypothetical protein
MRVLLPYLTVPQPIALYLLLKTGSLSFLVNSTLPYAFNADVLLKKLCALLESAPRTKRALPHKALVLRIESPSC